jgi:hypothetical protein
LLHHSIDAFDDPKNKLSKSNRYVVFEYVVNVP